MKVCYFLSHYPSHRAAGEQYIECLRLAGIELTRSPRDADAVIIHNESQSIAGYFRMHPELRERRVIAYSVWETDRLPPHYRFSLGLAGEIWTCSRHCRDVLVQAGRPVSIVPHVVVAPPRDPVAESKMRERIGAGPYVFYTINVAPFVRKGVDEVVAAFREEFPNGEARLVVKSASLPPQVAATPGVMVIPEFLPANELAALHYIADCYVSAHHAEGWGLTLSDAMAAGRPVIATAYSGNMEFMNERNSLPVACSVETIRARDLAAQPDTLTPDMHWAYADPADLRRQMRRAFEDREHARALGEQARRDLDAFAPERIAPVLRELLGCS